MRFYKILFPVLSGYLLGAVLAAGAVADRLAAPLERVATYRLQGHTRKFVTAGNDRGAVSPTMPLPSMTIALQPTQTQKAELQAFLLEVQNPASSSYHKWLTPEQYADRFGASANDVAKVTAWLSGQGLSVDATSRGRRWVRFHGTAAQVQTAFRTEIRNYDYQGRTIYANATAPALPAALGPMVLTVRGLTGLRMRPAAKLHRQEYNVGAGHYLAPADLSTIYNTAPLLAQGIDGTGQKIAILGAANVNANDINTFRTLFGLPANTPQTVRVGGTFTPLEGDQIEAALDLETVGGVAPGATLILVWGSDTEAALAYAIDNTVAPVISSSFSFGYGLCDSTDFAYDALYQQAEVQYGNTLGITVVSAAGDGGAAGCEYSPDGSSVPVASFGKGVAIPAGIPEVTAVGGTELREGNQNYWNSSNAANGGSAKSYIPEVAWNNSARNGDLSASGGGPSAVFQKPFWQTGTGVPNDGARDVPDVSLSASQVHDPYYMCWTSDGSGAGSGNCFGVGGTSAATPAFAGMVALLNHYQVAKGLQTTSGQGNLNPGLYKMAQAVPSAFHDITAGDNIVPCSAGSIDCVNGYLGFSTGPGFDLVTGLGSVDAFNLISNWNASAGAISTTTVVSGPTATVAQNSSLLLTVTVTAAAGSAAPTGTVTFNAQPSLQLTNGQPNWQYIGKATLTGSGNKSTGSMNFYPAQFYGYTPQSITAVYSGDGTFRSSGQTFNISFSNPTASSSLVGPSVNFGATNQGIIYPVDPDTDGYRYFFELDLFEFNGVGTTLTDMKIDGVSYAAQLNSIFGGTQIPGFGSLIGKIRWTPPTSPYTTYVEVSGKDANGTVWVQQTPLIVASRQLFGNMTLLSDPSPVERNASNTSCPWSQQLSLFETNGHSVQLTAWYSNNNDLTSSIQSYFGTTTLAPYGLLTAQVCFNGNPGQIQWEIDGTDDLGNGLAGFSTNNFYNAATEPGALTVAPATMNLNVPTSGQTATATLNVSVPAGQPWSIFTYPANKSTNWLSVAPAGGTGPATVTLSANGAGFATGTYLAQIVVSGADSSQNGINTVPGIVSVPVVFTVGQTGGSVVAGLQNAASFAQSYAPGMLMAVYGSNLAPQTISASSLPLPKTLSGVSATVNGVPAPLWFISPGQVNLQIPYETSAGTAVVGINNNGQVSSFNFQVVPVGPGIFSLNGSLNPDGTAKAGSQAFLYLTGDGVVSPALPSGTTPAFGTPLSGLPAPIGTLSITVGGMDAPVVFKGVTSGSVGVTQVNFQLPAGLTGVQPVVATVNGVASAPVNLTITN